MSLAVDEALWNVLLELRSPTPVSGNSDTQALASVDDQVIAVSADDDSAILLRSRDTQWQPRIASEAFELYGAYANNTASWCVAHLGQSLDGYVATRTGDSYYVTGEDNLDHLHRMRALADAVVVGAQTIRDDNPRLTTRRVTGPDPVRVVIDPRLSLDPASYHIGDQSVPSLIVCGEPAARANDDFKGALLPIEEVDGYLAPSAIRSALADRGLTRLFVEGGGATVSRFVNDDMVDVLQIAVAPIVVGRGRRGIDLEPVDAMSQSLRAPTRSYAMGDDVMFVLDLSSRSKG